MAQAEVDMVQTVGVMGHTGGGGYDIRSLQHLTGSQIPQNPDFSAARLLEPVCAKEERASSPKMTSTVLDAPMDGGDCFLSVR